MLVFLFLLYRISVFVIPQVMEELNASVANWLSDLEMDDYDLFPQCQLNLLDDEDQFLSHDIVSALQGENLELHQNLSSESNSSYHTSTSKTLSNASTDETSFERPSEQLKTSSTSWNSSSIITEHFSPVLSPSSSPSSSPTSQILSFENSNSSPANTATTTQFYGFDGTLNPKQNDPVSGSLPQPGNMSFSAQPQKGSPENNKNFVTRKPQGQGTKRPPAHAQDHILAERKRREKLSQSLIALAALIPGLKKMDKASVLGDAIKYVKELQERLKVLEEQSNKREVESVVIVNKPQASSDDDSSSCDDERFEAGGGGGEALPLPHVEARVAEKEVLLRIHCQKQKGLYVKLLSEIQSLHLFVVNSSVLPFGDSVLDITIVAQMGTDYNLTIKDLVRSLRVATLKSMS